MKTILCATVISIVISQSSGLHEGIPPTKLQSLNVNTWMTVGNVVGTFNFYTSKKEIVATWRYYPQGVLVGSPSLTELQTFQTSFWPTSVEIVGTNTLLVAGKESRSDDTRIERWTMRVPTVRVELGPDGQAIPGLHVHPTDDRVVIYDDGMPGRDMVHFMLDLRNPTSEALVRFWDSGDVYRIDWGNAPYTLTRIVTASDPVPGELVETALVGPFDTAARGDHLTLGYVYWFAHEESLGANPIVAMFDGDRDGSIDSIATYTTSDWASGPFGIESNWSELGGRPTQ